MNLNRWLFRRGKPYVGPVCWGHPDLCKDVKRPGYYATKTMRPGVGDKVRKHTPLVPDGEGGWRYG
jgi:hypothetical protein